MSMHELSFAKISILQDDIAEVIVNEGVDVDTNCVDELHGFLLANLRAPFSLLVNRVNAYAYEFDAQRNLGALEEINAVAVIAYTAITKTSTEMLTAVPRDMDWNLQIFSNREEGLVWLTSEQKKLGGKTGD